MSTSISYGNNKPLYTITGQTTFNLALGNKYVVQDTCLFLNLPTYVNSNLSSGFAIEVVNLSNIAVTLRSLTNVYIYNSYSAGVPAFNLLINTVATLSFYTNTAGVSSWLCNLGTVGPNSVTSTFYTYFLDVSPGYAGDVFLFPSSQGNIILGNNSEKDVIIKSPLSSFSGNINLDGNLNVNTDAHITGSLFTNLISAQNPSGDVVLFPHATSSLNIGSIQLPSISLLSTTLTLGSTTNTNIMNLNATTINANGTLVSTSDYRLKNDITNLPDTYSVSKLRAVQYKMNNKIQLGLIAHELQEHFPELVEGVKDGKDYQRVNYLGLIPILIRDIQRLNEKIDKLDPSTKARNGHDL